MDSNAGYKALNEVFALTQKMHEKAQASLWDELIELDKQRQQLIESIFPIENAEQNVRQILQKIIELNSQLELLCNDAKTNISLQLAALNRNEKAVNAYQQK